MAKFNTCHQLPSEMVNLATLDAHGLAYRLTEASRASGLPEACAGTGLPFGLKPSLILQRNSCFHRSPSILGPWLAANFIRPHCEHACRFERMHRGMRAAPIGTPCGRA